MDRRWKVMQEWVLPAIDGWLVGEGVTTCVTLNCCSPPSVFRAERILGNRFCGVSSPKILQIEISTLIANLNSTFVWNTAGCAVHCHGTIFTKSLAHVLIPGSRSTVKPILLALVMAFTRGGLSPHGTGSRVVRTTISPVPVLLYWLTIELNPSLSGLRAPERPLFTHPRFGFNPGDARDRSFLSRCVLNTLPFVGSSIYYPALTYWPIDI